MKCYPLFLIILFTSSGSFAQVRTWMWVKGAGGNNEDMSSSTVVDASGNIYMAGFFYSPSLTFDSITLVNHADYSDIYLTKLDSSGKVLWAINPTGTNYNSEITSIGIDLDGNIYIAGWFRDDSITFGSYTLSNTGMFVAKYDTAGNVIWAKSLDGAGINATIGSASSVVVDGPGNIYVTGYFFNSYIMFGSYTLYNTNSSGSTSDVFLVKYNPSGNVLWASGSGFIGNDQINTSAIDLNGDFYVAGISEASVWVDIFITKYDTSGNTLWSKTAVGDAFDELVSMTTDAENNIYLTGSTYSDTIQFGTVALPSCGYQSILLVKYDSGGNLEWVNCVGGGGGKSITHDNSGNIYITGSFSSDSIIFGFDTLMNSDTGALAFGDIFISGYDTSGNSLWAESVGGIYNDWASSINWDGEGNIYLTGNFRSPTLAIEDTLLNNSGITNFFIAKLGFLNATGTNAVLYFPKTPGIFPNPFLNSTTISFSLTKTQNISLKIVDLSGKLATTLIDKILEAGDYEWTWDAAEVNAGVYFLQFQSAENFLTKKFIVVN